MERTSPVDLLALGTAACGARLWRGPGGRRLTVVVKTLLSLVHDGRAKVVPGAAIAARESHHQQSPHRSVEEASDLAPYLARCDVTLRGHAFAPPGQAVPAMTVRLAVYRTAPILDKKLYVYGERDPSAPDRRRPFQRMPLDWEHALGGRSHPDNPVGRGAEAAGPGAQPPNVLDPRDPGRPAGFAPLSRFWGQRARSLGATARDLADAGEPELREGFDWRYFQAAPLDQQVPYLAGDEWIVLDGMHPALPRVSTQLPGARGAAMVHTFAGGAFGPGRPLQLVLDTLAVDADRQLAALVWRGNLVLDPAVDPSQLKVVGGVWLEGSPIPWPDPRSLAQPRSPGVPRDTSAAAPPASIARAPAAPPRAPERDVSAETSVLALSDEQLAALDAALPFVDAAQEPDPDDAGATSLLDLDASQRAALERALPFVDAPPQPPAPAPPAPPPQHADDETDESAATMLFALSESQRSALDEAEDPDPDDAGATRLLDLTPAQLAALDGALPFEGASPKPKAEPEHDEGVETQLLTLSASQRAALDSALPFEAPPPPAPPGALLPPRPSQDAPGAAAAPPPFAAAPAAPVRFVPQAQPAFPPAAVAPPAAAAVPFAAQPPPPAHVARPPSAVAAAHAVAPAAPPPLLAPTADAASAGPPLPPAAADGAEAPFPAAGAAPSFPLEAPVRKSPQVPIVNRTPLAAATTPWQIRPSQDSLTILLKGTFDLVPGGRATIRDEADPLTGDVHAGDDPRRSLVHASDFAIMKPRADVVLTGHAHAPKGSATRARVTFRFGGGAAPRGFERAIHVLGDRAWKKAAIALAPGDPAPFERMPLVYERAFGGPAFADNPAGAGHGGAGVPNLEDPDRPMKAPGDTPPPACFAPIAPQWKERWSKLGTYDAEWFASRWPYFPADFDWSHFQAAPRQQQVDHLRGDEAFEITGMHPEHPVFRGSLPGLRARAFALRKDLAPDLIEITLRADTAAFDMDEGKLQLVWRGLLEVSDDEAPEIESLFVHVEDLESAPLPLDAIRQLFLEAAAADAPEVEPPELPAPAPPPDPETVAQTRARVAALLAAGERLDGLDLAGARIFDADFEGRSLAGVILKDAVLHGSRFAGADLSGAVLAGADLTGCDLRAAILEGADLVGATLEGAIFDGANLEAADLSLVRADRASFRNVTGAQVQLAGGSFAGARFDRAELPGADLTEATLDGASFEEAILPEARLYHAKAEGARFDRAHLSEARCDDATLVKSSFEGAKAPSSVWEKSTLSGSTFLGADLAGASFCRASCEAAVFSRADAPEARFARARLAGASFLKANLMLASFERADLTGADLRGANLHAAETWKAKLAGTKLDLAIVTRSKLKSRA